MKKLLVFSLILGFIFTNLSFSAKGQDSTEIAWTKHIKQAIDNRPNPELFSEKEAWSVLLGENSESQNFTFKRKEYANFYFNVQEITSTEFYSRSYTSSRDGWWYTTIVDYKESEWKVNYPFIIPLTISILFLIFSITKVSWYYNKAKKRLEGNPNMITPFTWLLAFYLILAIIFIISDMIFFLRKDPEFVLIELTLITLAYFIASNKIKDLSKKESFL